MASFRLLVVSFHEAVRCTVLLLDHRQPKLKLGAVIILRNSGHGVNMRVCMGIFMIGLRR